MTEIEKWINKRQAKCNREPSTEPVQIDMTKAAISGLVEDYDAAREKKRLREEKKK